MKTNKMNFSFKFSRSVDEAQWTKHKKFYKLSKNGCCPHGCKLWYQPYPFAKLKLTDITCIDCDVLYAQAINAIQATSPANSTNNTKAIAADYFNLITQLEIAVEEANNELVNVNEENASLKNNIEDNRRLALSNDKMYYDRANECVEFKEKLASLEKKHAEEKEAHAATKKLLVDERVVFDEKHATETEAHAATKKLLVDERGVFDEKHTTETEAHAATKKLLVDEKNINSENDFIRRLEEEQVVRGLFNTLGKENEDLEKKLTTETEKNINLEDAYLKQLVGAGNFNKLLERGGIKRDAGGHIVKVSVFNDDDMEEGPGVNDDVDYYLDDDELGQIQFDIKDLNSMSYLTKFSLSCTKVSGDIKDLPTNLTSFYLKNTGVSGDIKHLNSMPNLTDFDLRTRAIRGDIKDIHDMLNLNTFHFRFYHQDGELDYYEEDEYKIFNWYRNKHGLSHVFINVTSEGYWSPS